ncbi:MAG: type II secretion system F family protein, partial [Candidatus Phosphoribacter sp.]
LGLMALAAIALTPAFRSHRLERMQTVEAYAARGSVAPLRREAPGLFAANLVDMGDKFMAGRASTSRTMALLQRADLPWRPGEWAMLRVVALCVGGVIGLVLFRDGWIALVGIIVGLLAGLLLPAVGLRFLARRRSTQCERQLPDILMLIASSLSTGFSLPQSLDAVARDVADPAAKEFARVMAETRIGAEIEDALERMALRMDSDNMRWTAMAIRIQRQVGGNLAETLRTAAATLREREYLRRHVRGLSAEGRLSAYLLVALPILLFIYEVNVNRDYISLLWTTTLGWALTAGSVVMMSIGILWMNKAVKVEV